MITKESLAPLIGEITWCWNHLYFIETSIGNFVWSDPNYLGGDNTIRPFNGTFNLFRKSCANIPYGRDKGKHIIKDYCPNFEFVDVPFNGITDEL